MLHKALYSYEHIEFSQQHYKMGIHIPILEVRKPRLKEVMYRLTQTANGGTRVTTFQPDSRASGFPPPCWVRSSRIESVFLPRAASGCINPILR